jgi:pterin-4a-carbinolamine dehydratase
MDIGNLIFLSYRRTDTAPQAIALKLELESRLQAAQVFLDLNSMQGGETWPARIEEAVETSEVVIALIGPAWAAEGNGVRRIDDPADWVRRELDLALRKEKKSLIPVLVDGASLPANLAPPLNDLANRIQMRLQTTDWDSLVRSLVATLKADFRFEERQRRYELPPKGPIAINTAPYTWTQLETAILPALQGWMLELSDDPENRGYKRIELVRDFKFPSFEVAMSFVQTMASYATAVDHHPRWMNVWRTLTVWLSTWDTGQGHRVTSFDAQFAKHLNDEYSKI